MSKIDELITFLEADKASNIMSDTSRWDKRERKMFDKAIALLKAGQEMRLGASLKYKDVNSLVDLLDGAEAWDTALKGEKE